VHLGLGQVERPGDLRHRRFRHVAEGVLDGVEQRQQRALEVPVLLDDHVDRFRRRCWLCGWHGSSPDSRPETGSGQYRNQCRSSVDR
jgi:hypothetical protein